MTDYRQACRHRRKWSSFRFITLVAVGLLIPAIADSKAATVTWDADPGVAGAQDGSGNWDTAPANWI
ncbi:MAG: hypothetical protein U1E05_19180, partial [Patescibacteria group bacterium]|nr:hypothetical protein [Patescibacteria group bacterium]